MSFCRTKSYVATSLLIAVIGINCGGGRPVADDESGVHASISGFVVKGPVSNSTVTAYSVLPMGERGPILGLATTDASGAFTISDVPSYNGSILLVAKGGTYAEEAIADATVRLDLELTYWLPTFEAGSQVRNLAITPISHLAAGLAAHWVETDGKSITVATEEAWVHINNHFGGLHGNPLDWRTVNPTNLSGGTWQMDGPGKAGLILSALSMEARAIAERAGVTPGVSMTTQQLVEALYRDIRTDGFFDGSANGRSIILPSDGTVVTTGPSASSLDGQTLRLTLGQSIQSFIQSDRNHTGLTLNDGLPLIQQITANSDASLFRTLGTTFDHSPPGVAFNVKFSRNGGAPHDPVGSNHLAGGTLTVTADITDASTIQGATLSANGTRVPTTSHGTDTTLTLNASVVTEADGPLILTVNSTDVHGNEGSSTYILTIDNTPPSIAIPNGAPGATYFYSQGVPVDVTATDANGITSFTQNGLDGFVNRSGVLNRLSGTWEVPVAVPDGPQRIELTASDAVFNVTKRLLIVNVDRSAPVVSVLGSTPPRYVRDASLTFRVLVRDPGAGVRAVKASVNGAPEATATVSGEGTYNISLDLGQEGNKRILVWAVDAANPVPNSSYESALSFDVTLDTTNPSPILQTGVGTYYDERPTEIAGLSTTPGMGVELDDAGNPLVPVRYTFPTSAAKRPVVGAGDIYKAATRLSWGSSAPGVGALYGQDGATMNVPFLIYDVPQTASQAPITSMPTYSIKCLTCASEVASTGVMLRDTSFAGDPQRFLLPLSAETVPGLTAPGRDKHIEVRAEFADAAGNHGIITTDLNFHVIGPPLVITEDVAYPSRGDPRSLFGCRMGLARSYATLFGSGTSSFDEEGPRLVRYVVQNASDFSVAFSATLDSVDIEHIEAWNDIIRNAYGGTDPDAEPRYIYSLCAAEPFTPTPAPCGGLSGTYDSGLYRGSFPSTCARPASSIPAEGGWLNPSAPVAHSRVALISALADETIPENHGRRATVWHESYLVPAASATAPGQIVVYVHRPREVIRDRPIKRTDVMGSSTVPLGDQAYSYTVEDFWYQTGFPSSCCTDTGTQGTPQCISDGARYYALRRHAKYLTSASTTASGDIRFAAQGLVRAGDSLLGESSRLVLGSFHLTFEH